MRLAYLAKAMSKRVWKLDSGEDADDMMKWEVGRCEWKQESEGGRQSSVSSL